MLIFCEAPNHEYEENRTPIKGDWFTWRILFASYFTNFKNVLNVF